MTVLSKPIKGIKKSCLTGLGLLGVSFIKFWINRLVLGFGSFTWCNYFSVLKFYLFSLCMLNNIPQEHSHHVSKLISVLLWIWNIYCHFPSAAIFQCCTLNDVSPSADWARYRLNVGVLLTGIIFVEFAFDILLMGIPHLSFDNQNAWLASQ